MKLKQINIINFGQLSNLTFDLPSSKLALFFGENEAGKSTTVAFIKQIMFGFYLRSNSSPFFEDYKPLAHVSPMGGSLIFEDEQGDEYKLERLWAKGDKTKKGILTVTKDGQQVPENLFFDQIKNIDGNFYADSFIFNQEMLGQVANLSQADLLERIYYLGAANSSQLLDLRDDFEKEAGRLFKKTGKKPEVNQLLAQVDQQREEVKDAENQFQDYEQLHSEFEQKQTLLKEERAKLAKLQVELQHQQKLLEQEASYEQLQKLKAEVKTVKFDANNYRQAQELSAQIKNLQSSLDTLKKQLDSIDNDQSADHENVRKVLQKKSELLQWQSEYQNCLDKAEQLKIEKSQLLQLNPELKTIASLSDEQIQQMQAQAEIFSGEDKTEPERADNSKYLMIVATVVAVLGLTQISNSLFIGLILFVVGLAVLGYVFYQHNQIQKENQAHKQKVSDLEQEVNLFIQKYGFDPRKADLRSILTARNTYLLRNNAEKANNDRIKAITDNLAQLSGALEKITQKPVKSDFTAVLSNLSRLEEVVEQENEQKAQILRLQTSQNEQLQQLKELQLKLNAVLAKDEVEQMPDYDQRYQESLSQTKLQTQISALKENLEEHIDELKELDKDKIAQFSSEIKAKITAQTTKTNQLQQEIAEITVKLHNLADSDAVMQAKQKLANTEAQFLNSSKEYLANLLASKWISRSLDIASNERFPKMIEAAREYLKLLTGGRYTDIILDKKLSVVRFDGKKREVKYLSRGTAEQLYFSLKLAFAQQIKDQINLPILIDDSFVNFDDRRISYIEQLLNKISENNQVLIFTAQKNLVDKMKIKPLTFRKDTANA